MLILKPSFEIRIVWNYYKQRRDETSHQWYQHKCCKYISWQKREKISNGRQEWKINGNTCTFNGLYKMSDNRRDDTLLLILENEKDWNNGLIQFVAWKRKWIGPTKHTWQNLDILM